ncbi:MAG: hypothetical protein M0Z31_15055 [Clostridia bacterium]|nr:hypothetical protein [Clostridia bacterium]
MDTFSHGFWLYCIFRRFAHLRQLILGAVGPDMVFIIPYPLVLLNNLLIQTLNLF